MPLFYYRAKTPQGRAMEGTIDAPDQREAARVLRGRGLLVTALSESRDAAFRGAGAGAGSGGSRPAAGRGAGGRSAAGQVAAAGAGTAPAARGVTLASGGARSGARGANLSLGGGRVNLKELSLFCRQFATMLDAGVPILTSLNILARQAASKKMRLALAQVVWSIEQGHSLSDAFRMRRDIFPVILVNMVAAGEAGGILEESFERLAEHFEKEHAVSQKVKSAMTYPAVVSVVAIGVVIFMLVFVLPSFVGIFSSIGAELPALTRGILAVSDFIRQSWYLLVAGITLFIVGFKLYAGTEGGAYSLDSLALRLPVFGELILKRAVSRFSRTLGTLLRSGVPLLVCLQVVEQTVGNRPIALAIARAGDEIRAGRGISDPLRASRLFPPMVLEMMAVGEETGAVDQMLTKVADFYDKDIDTVVERLSSAIEPLIIVFLGGIVGFILIALIMPMFDIYSQLNL